MATRPMTAWLIWWEAMGDHEHVDQPIVDIVSARRSERQIKDYIQKLHDMQAYTLTERTDYAKYSNPPQKPYEVDASWTNTGLILTIGHNPVLTARKVKNLVVSIDDETDQETVTWDPYP